MPQKTSHQAVAVLDGGRRLIPWPVVLYGTKRAAGIIHGKGIHTLRHCFATHLLEAGVDLHTIQLLLGHRAIDTTTRYLRITRQHLAKVHSPFDLLGVAAGLPSAATE